MPRKLETTVGIPHPLGFSTQGARFNFSLFSSFLPSLSLGLFEGDDPVYEIPMNRTGDVWHIGMIDLPPNLEYAYKVGDEWVQDPYAKLLNKNRAKATLPPPFDWQQDNPPSIPLGDVVIYEMHVRGFTIDPSSSSNHPGTFLGVIEKIPYLKKLGVNVVELMPIFPSDSTYWGYDPTHFFAPNQWYAEKDPFTECKVMVRELHKQGIEVFLDVVFNHTGGGSLRSIDKNVYYMLDERGKDLNFTGCGNTLNVNHPIVQNLILDSLLYWIEEMHIDGFRFDLASILTRDTRGTPVNHPSILERIQQNSALSKVKLIAEAWDAAGLYQMGLFPTFGNWSEWNGPYRDAVRKFLKGEPHQEESFKNALLGSPTIYKKTPLSSVNFITAHDGFCLIDLVTYEQKRNEVNGEGNRDGCNHNDNWNCGVEGPTENAKISKLREQQIRNFLLTLFISQGIPMLLMGDEIGHTRKGNNNPYNQDNSLNWQEWQPKNPKMFSFISSLIALRKKHKNLKEEHFVKKQEMEWQNPSEHLATLLLKKHSPHLFIAFNASRNDQTVAVPSGKWNLIVHTEEDWVFHESGPEIAKIELPPFTSTLLVKMILLP